MEFLVEEEDFLESVPYRRRRKGILFVQVPDFIRHSPEKHSDDNARQVMGIKPFHGKLFGRVEKKSAAAHEKERHTGADGRTIDKQGIPGRRSNRKRIKDASGMDKKYAENSDGFDKVDSFAAGHTYLFSARKPRYTKTGVA